MQSCVADEVKDVILKPKKSYPLFIADYSLLKTTFLTRMLLLCLINAINIIYNYLLIHFMLSGTSQNLVLI